VRINADTHTHSFVAGFNTPYLPKRQEETLIWCKAVDLGIAFTCSVFLKAFVGDSQTANIGKVFALGKAAIYMQVVQYCKFVVLFNHH
jgi:hypothetical protein